MGIEPETPMSTTMRLCAAILALAAAPLAATPAAAQGPGYEEQFGAFEGELAPGYTPPGDIVFEEEREALLPFGERLDVEGDSFDRPLNEIAGQRRRYEPGLLDGLIGRALGVD